MEQKDKIAEHLSSEIQNQNHKKKHIFLLFFSQINVDPKRERERVRERTGLMSTRDLTMRLT